MFSRYWCAHLFVAPVLSRNNADKRNNGDNTINILANYAANPRIIGTNSSSKATILEANKAANLLSITVKI
jgi:hypothetical protein